MVYIKKKSEFKILFVIILRVYEIFESCLKVNVFSSSLQRRHYKFVTMYDAVSSWGRHDAMTESPLWQIVPIVRPFRCACVLSS